MQTSTYSLSPKACTENIPLSVNQIASFLFEQTNSDSISANHSVALRLVGSIDVNIVNNTLKRIIDRHTIFKTIFINSSNHITQKLISDFNFEGIIETDLRDLDEDEKQAELNWLIIEAAEEPFDLSQEPLFKFEIFQLNDDEHVLLLVIHQILFDEYSDALFAKEFALIYDALNCSNSSLTDLKLADLKIQYHDFCFWQQEQIENKLWEKQTNYWKEQFNSEHGKLNFPSDSIRTGKHSIHSIKKSFSISEELSQSLFSLSKANNVSTLAILLSAFKILLHLYTGKEDIVVGIQTSGRNQATLKPVIGSFVNRLALRSNLSSNLSFQEFLLQIHSTLTLAYENQDIPFEEILKALKLENKNNQNPLFQVLFKYYPLVNNTIQSEALEIKIFEFESCNSTYELEITVKEKADGLCIYFTYNAELFHDTTIEQARSYYFGLLEDIVVNPGLAISALILLTHTKLKNSPTRQSNVQATIQEQESFIEFHREDINTSIIKRFEHQVNKHPANTAIKTTNESFNYQELNQKTNIISHEILQNCKPEEQRVALVFNQGASMIVGLLAALKANKTYIPLDASIPKERAKHIFNNAQIQTVITSSENLELTKNLIPESVGIIDIDRIIAQRGNDENPDILSTSESPAYIIYTSGSTGKPKGVLQNHKNVLHFVSSYTNQLQINHHDKLSLLSSYNFDAAIVDIFSALLNGASLHIFNLKKETLKEVSARLKDEQVSIYHSTPTVYRYFIHSLSTFDSSEETSSPSIGYPKIRLVVLGGEQVYKQDIDAYKTQFDADCRLVNLFGSTESSISMMNIVNKETDLPGISIPMGSPIKDTEIILLNKEGKETAIFGEIGIMSNHIALEYWQEPELSASTFIEVTNSRKRLYRTGDIARLLPNGSLEHLGRKDFQVKIRGYRIEIAEIEGILSEHKQIAKCVVSTNTNNNGEQFLTANYIAKPMQTPDPDELKLFLKDLLPDYMMPSKFRLMDSFPLTASGKIDKKKLSEIRSGPF